MTTVRYHDKQQQQHHQLVQHLTLPRLRDAFKTLKRDQAKAAGSPVSRLPPTLEKKRSLVIVNFIVSNAKSARIHCRCTQDYKRNSQIEEEIPLT